MVASPAATGGAGTTFEHQVDAFWLAVLLVRGIPPVLRDAAIRAVHLQTRHAGFATDDVLVEAETASGVRRRLFGQMKRSFTVSASDDDCVQTISDFWQDFTSAFDVDADRLALITRHGTNLLLQDFVSLLDCARAAPAADEFERRVGVPGFVSKRARSQLDAVRTIVRQKNGSEPAADHLWRFLRVIHVLSLDLTTASGHTEALVKSMLAMSASGPDCLATAESTWARLVVLAGEGAGAARTFARDDLPAELCERHAPVASADTRVLQALLAHSETVLNRIRTTIGSGHVIPRDKLVHRVHEALERSRVVLIAGDAGVGKSAIAKLAVNGLSLDQFAFAFRAAEFARAHLDEVLHQAQIGCSAVRLSALLAGQHRHVLLVDSVERLLEAAPREAFLDFLGLVARNLSWRVILTCRSYSAESVRRSFLEHGSLSHEIITVPPLEDAELGVIATIYPPLQRPLSDPRLKRLLASPYVLDKAMTMDWSAPRPLPQSSREFRERFWKEIVAPDSRPGVAIRREAVFAAIALRRARGLTDYADATDLDPEVLDLLHRDSLLLRRQDHLTFVTPAHDLLEDWAILRWFEGRRLAGSDLPTIAMRDVGTHPALRRGFRSWVAEMLSSDAAISDELLRSSSIDAGLPAHAADDILVGLLQGGSRPTLDAALARNEALLLANGRGWMHRIMHLVRVACVELGPPQQGVPRSLRCVPIGPAWPAILEFASRHRDAFSHDELPALLGLLEDWARGVSFDTPYPPGSEAVAAIAHHLVDAWNHYSVDEPRKRALRVIAKVPRADGTRFVDLLERDPTSGERDRAAEDLRAIVLEELAPVSACRDFPKAIASAVIKHVLIEGATPQECELQGDPGIEASFGIRSDRRGDYFPASALQGPFIFLLRQHPQIGIDLILELMDASMRWMVENGDTGLEALDATVLRLDDSHTSDQWANERLWNLYRGTSVGPNVLQSAAMALERWLLENAPRMGSSLDSLLLTLLRNSRSGVVAAVVASVATAHSLAATRTVLTLLSSRECVLLDRTRMGREIETLSRLQLPAANASDKLHYDDRLEMDALGHRNRDLQTVVLELQLTADPAPLHAAIDRHTAALPPFETAPTLDLGWRLALTRMDARRYDAKRMEAETADRGTTTIVLEPQPHAPFVREHVRESLAATERHAMWLRPFLWATRVWSSSDPASADPREWRAYLVAAMSPTPGPVGEDLFGVSDEAPGLIAAIVARDHWNELMPDERSWCIGRVCATVLRRADHWRGGLMGMPGESAEKACAEIVWWVLVNVEAEQRTPELLRACFATITHASEAVRAHSARAIAGHAWSALPGLALQSANAIVLEARHLAEAYASGRARSAAEHDARRAASAAAARLALRENRLPTASLDALDPAKWHDQRPCAHVLTILSGAPQSDAAGAAFTRVAQRLVSLWCAPRRRGHAGDRPRDYELEHAWARQLAEFSLVASLEAGRRVLATLVESVEREPSEAADFFVRVVLAEDRLHRTDRFWEAWTLFASSSAKASWLSSVDARYSHGPRKMISAIFLGHYWKAEADHWKALDDHAHRIDDLFTTLPGSEAALDAYCRFLYGIGSHSLPNAFVRIAEKLGPARGALLTDGNTVFMLEVMLERYVYGRPAALKASANMRAAVLSLLDALVASGSSAAFRMRDDFVTPLPPNPCA